jgi:hypothetical protein
MKVVVTCYTCGREFEKESKEVKKSTRLGNNIYCSRECHTTNQKTGKILQCANCGKDTYKTISQVIRSRSSNLFCSQSCANSYNLRGKRLGSTHPNYNGGNSSYRISALRSSSMCSICGYDIVDTLEVHHKDGNRKNNNLDNLDVLCPTHHKEHHIGIRSY